MEIRIPTSAFSTFAALVNDEDLKAEFNIRAVVTKSHAMRNGETSYQVNLTYFYSASQSRKFRGKRDRLTNSICFHGHETFMSLLFERIPTARIRSVMTERTGTKWMTAANFAQVSHMARRDTECHQSYSKHRISHRRDSPLPGENRQVSRQLSETSQDGRRSNRVAAFLTG
jgi:hypothetical protein